MTRRILFFPPRNALGPSLVIMLILDLVELELRLSLLCSTTAASLPSKIYSPPFVLR
jgi:hypothetical protein